MVGVDASGVVICENKVSGGAVNIETAYTEATLTGGGGGYAARTSTIQSAPPITTSGGKVTIFFNGLLAGSDSSSSEDSEPIDVYHLRLFRDSTQIHSLQLEGNRGAAFGDPTSLVIIDNPPTGTYTYHAKLYKAKDGSGSFRAKNRALMIIAK